MSKLDDNYGPPIAKDFWESFPPLLIKSFCYGSRGQDKLAWAPCILEDTSSCDQTLRVKFIKVNRCEYRCLFKSQIAYGTPHKYRLPVGTRVIAYFNSANSEDKDTDFLFHPGTIAETITQETGGRYLVFFDNDHAQYINHLWVRLICNNVKSSPWEQVPRFLRENVAPNGNVQTPPIRSKIVASKNSTKKSNSNNRDGKLQLIHLGKSATLKEYSSHTCSAKCIPQTSQSLRNYGALSKPLQAGWERRILKSHIDKHGKVLSSVMYIAPCGAGIRTMNCLWDHIKLTDSPLNVENFDFSPEVRCLTTFAVDNFVLKLNDISSGQERLSIELVNSHDVTKPAYFEYSTLRIPTEGLEINTDGEFLTGCDCVDDCFDKKSCKCFQLTLDGARTIWPHKDIDKIGYTYKRLNESIPTGIYECNSRCKCSSRCLNRVVQNQIEHRLQVFKTTNRGWGVRCLEDIPKGAFVCVYSGEILTDTKANMDSADTYFADIDFIKISESCKIGYENSVVEMDDEPAKEDKIMKGENSVSDEEESSKTLNLLGGELFVLDAKNVGNVGRFMNHSCDPNLCVENVFVDTHDLRLPWVSFFSYNKIPAGEELSFNYGYKVDSVANRILLCKCGSANCIKRLL